jgi:hypothetical protein
MPFGMILSHAPVLRDATQRIALQDEGFWELHNRNRVVLTECPLHCPIDIRIARPMKDEEMAKSYYSLVLDHPAQDVWTVIRPFDHYAWAGVESETVIESEKAGDQVSAIRRVTMGDTVIRQILLAHSDADRSYTYAFCDPSPISRPQLRRDDKGHVGRRGRQGLRRMVGDLRLRRR